MLPTEVMGDFKGRRGHEEGRDTGVDLLRCMAVASFDGTGWISGLAGLGGVLLGTPRSSP